MKPGDRKQTGEVKERGQEVEEQDVGERWELKVEGRKSMTIRKERERGDERAEPHTASENTARSEKGQKLVI